MWTCQKYAVDTHRCCLKRDRHGNSIKFVKIPDALQSPDYGKCRCRTSILRRMILRAGETLDLKEPRNAGIWLDFTTRIMTSWDWKRYAFVHFFRSKRLLDTLDKLVIAFMCVSEWLPLSAGGERALDGQMGGFELNNLRQIEAPVLKCWI